MALYRYFLAAAFAIGLLAVPTTAQLVESVVVKDETNAADQRESSNAMPTPPPALGVIVTDSPGDGVLVTSVLRGGPAAQAGIRAGDFILAVAGKTIRTSAELRQAVRAADPKTDLAITFWREGTEMSANVSLASKFSNSVRERAWLGVLLETTEDAKVLVADVMPASPASRGGIRVGDVVVRIDAEKIDSVDEVLQLMERIKAGDYVDVTVLRDGQKRTITVRVGSAQRSMRWFDEWWPRVEIEEPWTEFTPTDVDMIEGYLEDLEDKIGRLRDEVRELRDQLRQRTQGKVPLDREELEDEQPSLRDEGTRTDDAFEPKNDTRGLPVAYRPKGKVRSYRNFRGGRPGVRYRYTYPRRYSYYGRGRGRGYYPAPTMRYFYYGPPPYYFYYYRRPGVGIYVGPRFYYVW